MATWADAGLVALGAAIGVGGTLGAAWLERRFSREDRDADERKARVERVAGVIGRVQTFLVDANPGRFLFLGQPEVVQMVERWQPLREELAVLAATEPASDLRDEMSRIDVEVANLLPGLIWIVSPEYRRAVEGADTSGEGRANKIKRHHEDAEEAARHVLELVHGESRTAGSQES